MTFPERRLRRLRRTPALRRMVAETRLSVDDLIAPLFVREGIDEPQPIASLPGVGPAHPRVAAQGGRRAGRRWACPASSCSACPVTKDARGLGAWDPDGIVQLALRDLRDDVGDRHRADGRPLPRRVHRPRPLRRARRRGGRGRQRRHARALRRRSRWPRPTPAPTSCAPSGMMDGQVGAIRGALDGDGLTPTSRSSPTRRSTRPRSTARSATRSTSRSPVAATARATSRTRATRARRWRRSAPTSTRAPTW